MSHHTLCLGTQSALSGAKSTYVVSIVVEGCWGRLEGVQPRGLDVDDHWVGLDVGRVWEDAHVQVVLGIT